MFYARIAKSTQGPGFHRNADSAALIKGFIYIYIYMYIYIATHTLGVR